jgi:hypothetical protein
MSNRHEEAVQTAIANSLERGEPQRGIAATKLLQHEGHEEGEGREGGHRAPGSGKCPPMIRIHFEPFVLLRGLRVRGWWPLKASRAADILPGSGTETGETPTPPEDAETL